jgi:hypothetical protein
MPSFAHSTGNTSSAGRATRPVGVSFLRSAVQGRTVESPQTGFQRPVINAVFAFGSGPVSINGHLNAIGPAAARLLARLLRPQTGAGRLVQTWTVNYLVDEFLQLIDPSPFSFVNFTTARQIAAKAATRFYRAYFSSTGEGNVSVVFIPTNEPGIDLLTWDP